MLKLLETLPKMIIKLILRVCLTMILENIFSLKSIFEKILRMNLIVILESIYTIFNT